MAEIVHNNPKILRDWKDVPEGQLDIPWWALVVRIVLKVMAWVGTKLLTRTRIEGLENIPREGAVIFTANHSSIYDGVLYHAFLPLTTNIVGPGDFRLRLPNRWAIEWPQMILVRRGQTDSASLRRMVKTLKNGAQLAMFPEGGTWEKGLYSVKDGASYLSMQAEAPIVPIAISGAYNIWGEIFSFKRPEIVMKFLPPMDVVPKVARKERDELLQRHNYDMMDRIYRNLTHEELDRYIIWMRMQYSGAFEVEGESDIFEEAHDYRVLAELISKMNLYSTFHEHLKLPSEPFLKKGQWFPVGEVVEAVDAIRDALEHKVPGYIEYRLGEDAAERMRAELTEAADLLRAVPEDRRVRFVVSTKLLDEEQITLPDGYTLPKAG